jgi:uncharacterized membrane protein
VDPVLGEWTFVQASPRLLNYGVGVEGAGENIYILNSYSSSASSCSDYATYGRGDYFMRYNTVTGYWEDLAVPPTTIKNAAHNMCWDHGNYIYMLPGGSYADAAAKSRHDFWRYNIANGTWETLPSTPMWHGPGDALVWVKLGASEYIYAWLGTTSFGVLMAGGTNPYAELWRFNITTNSWDNQFLKHVEGYNNLAQTASQAQRDNGIGADDGCNLVWTGGDYIYYTPGAYNESLPKDEERYFLRYTMSTNTLTRMANAPTTDNGGFDDGGSVVYPGFGDYIYAIKGGDDFVGGGCYPSVIFWRYKISTNTWENLPDLPYGVGGTNGCRLGYAGNGRLCYWVGPNDMFPVGNNNKNMYVYGITAENENVKTSMTLSISPSSFTIQSGGSITLTATLKDNDNNPLARKTINWSAALASGDNIWTLPVYLGSTTTDSSGHASITYTAPTVTTLTVVRITASFAGDNQYRASSGYSYGTITAPPVSVTWTRATAAAGWSARCGHTSVVFDNKIWVMGGLDGNYKNDVWYSSDGVNWTQATASAGWSARTYHTSVVFDGKMWVIGGWSEVSGFKNDVWYSSDGVNWTRATDNAAWSIRGYHTSIVFDGRMWVIGGYGGAPYVPTYKNDVWYSSDGVNWTRATALAGWSARRGHTSVVFDDKMWVIGGYGNSTFKNDVWYSSDGVNWTRATDNAAWSEGWRGREQHASVAFDGKMWVMGGMAEDAPAHFTFKNDVWYSSDGVNWTRATDNAAWDATYNARYGFASVVFNGKMWVIGGNTSGAYKNDVWYSGTAAPGSTYLSISPSSFTLQSGGSTTLTATLKDNANNPLANKTVSWSKTAGSLSSTSGTTNSSGQVSVTYTAPTVTTQTSVTVTASFAGDNQYQSSRGNSYGTIMAENTPTYLTIYPPRFALFPGYSGQVQALTATLRADNNPLPNKQITWSTTAGSVSPSSGTTNALGQVSVIYTAPTVTDNTLQVTITASFAGDAQYGASSGTSLGIPVVSVSVTIGYDGGTVVVNIIKIDVMENLLVVPENALSENTIITVVQAPLENLPDYKMVSHVFEVGPSGTTFTTPSTLTLPYDENELPVGVSEDDLAIYYYNINTGSWERVGGNVDTTANTVSVQVDHLSKYAVMAELAAAPEVGGGIPLIAVILAVLCVSAAAAASSAWIYLQRTREEATSKLIEHGLSSMSLQEADIFRKIREQKKFSIPELMRQTGASKTVTWRTVQKLIKKGLVQPTEKTIAPVAGRGKPSTVYKYVGD